MAEKWKVYGLLISNLLDVKSIKTIFPKRYIQQHAPIYVMTPFHKSKLKFALRYLSYDVLMNINIYCFKVSNF